MTQPALRRSLLLSLLDLSGETALRLQRELLLRWTQQALQLTTTTAVGVSPVDDAEESAARRERFVAAATDVSGLRGVSGVSAGSLRVAGRGHRGRFAER